MVVPARIVLFVWLSAASVAVLADDPEDELPRHRIDIGTSFLNTIAVDSFVATVGYTYNVTRSSNFNVTLPLIDPDTELSGDSGTGDLIAAYSWVPSLRVGANPWVPRTVGTGIAILAPTGSVASSAMAEGSAGTAPPPSPAPASRPRRRRKTTTATTPIAPGSRRTSTAS